MDPLRLDPDADARPMRLNGLDLRTETPPIHDQLHILDKSLKQLKDDLSRAAV